MIELDGLEDDDIMNLRIVVFNMMERRLAKTSSLFQEEKVGGVSEERRRGAVRVF